MNPDRLTTACGGSIRQPLQTGRLGCKNLRLTTQGLDQGIQIQGPTNAIRSGGEAREAIAARGQKVIDDHPIRGTRVDRSPVELGLCHMTSLAGLRAPGPAKAG